MSILAFTDSDGNIIKNTTGDYEVQERHYPHKLCYLSENSKFIMITSKAYDLVYKGAIIMAFNQPKYHTVKLSSVVKMVL